MASMGVDHLFGGQTGPKQAADSGEHGGIAERESSADNNSC